jgi:putative hydrolase
VAAIGTANQNAQLIGATVAAAATNTPEPTAAAIRATTVENMSNEEPPGFGFSPFGAGSGGSGNEDALSQMPFFAELQKLMSWTGGPVNWDLAKQIAVAGLSGSNPGTSPVDRAAITDAIRLADLWLNEVTDLPSGINNIETWTRLEWLEQTLPVWRSLCDPVASRVVEAMSSALPADQLQALGAMMPLGGIMSQVGGLMFGAQVGQGLAGLAHEVVSATDIGIPLGPQGVAALVPVNVQAFGEGLERPADEVRLYLALREAAHQRLFSHVPWLRQRLFDTIEAYSRGINVDLSAIESAMGSVDPSNPEAIQEALAGGLFEPQHTPEQQLALRRLETLLALVEGWVDAVVAAAAGDRMPGAEALREASRRRRATGGPAEQTFATLVGLELRPRRLREAAALWWGVTERHGVSGRDAVWSHPDLLPSADDLDDPLGFAEMLGADSPQVPDLEVPDLEVPDLDVPDSDES